MAHQKLIANCSSVAGRAVQEVFRMILDANLPCIVDLRTVRGYRCNECRIPAPKQSWRAWLSGYPAPSETVLYEHLLEDHTTVVNDSDNPEIGVGWTICLSLVDQQDVIAVAWVNHRAKDGWKNTCPALLTRKIGRLSEPLIQIEEILPKPWMEAANHMKSNACPRVFVSEAQEVLREKLAELEAATALQAGRKYHCATCANALGERCGENDGKVDKFCCPTCAQHGGDQCGCGRADATK